MKKEKNKKDIKYGKTHRGFTLIELLVSMTIFSLIIAITSGVFVSVLQAQRRLLAMQELFSQISYLEEYTSRAIRMANKDISGICITAKSNYEITYSDQGIRFMNYKGDCQEFYLSNYQLMENNAGVVSELTSSALAINNFNISLLGNSQFDNLQPRVTLSLNIKGTGAKVEQQVEMQIQTTISQRKLDVQY
ncbi:type II secretion system GspH family protein [Patescibacteria group bacterium]|nr:type II secretion system GspH family protein [Patescibacteria group bacterium]MBU1877211.1 type II secretion system GspH family protein [Patescibacteria group bacterium]